MRWIGIVLASLGILIGVLSGGSLGAFVSIPALVFVLLVGCGITIAAHGPRNLLAMITSVFRPIGPRLLLQLQPVASTGKQAFIVAGWIGVLVGTVQLLCQLDDPARIGPAASLVILSALYGYLIAYLVCLPVACRSATSEV